MGRNRKQPLYTLPHGIEVVGEYAPTKKNPYWRVRVRPHPFFCAAENSGGLYIRRSRVVMAAELGRRLDPAELVHHVDEDKGNDSPGNLEITTTAEHNARHKTGTTHAHHVKARIGASLRAAYQSGRRSPTTIKIRDNAGRIIST